MMLDFSIIIPVYNAQRTLERCLESIREQTFSNYEVVLIDDGSVDESLNICKRYEENDARYRVIHQSNSGPSVARNAGLNVAIGKWVCFIDSDDFVEPSYLQEIWNAAIKYDADVVFVGHHRVYANGEKEFFSPCEMQSTPLRIAVELSKQDMFGYTWIKAFRREAIKDMRFDFKLNLFEDEVFACQALPNCLSVGFVRKPIYNYTVGNEGSLIGRTYQDYCLKCDIVYNSWITMIDKDEELHSFMIEKANQFVSRCYYYAFERPVDIKAYFVQLRETTFFQDHTEYNPFDSAVRCCNYKKLRLEKIKYQIKARISSAICRKG